MKSLISSLLILVTLPFGVGLALGAGDDMADFQEIEIIKKTDVRFPGTMRAIGVKEGHVSLVVSIGKDGEILDTFILESTRKAFTKSALKSLADWDFAPAICDGTALTSSIHIDLHFQVDRRLAWQTIQAPGPADVTRTETKERPVTTSQFNELDSIPLPIEIIEPSNGIEGIATIEFYIDELGHVRCPRVTDGSSLEFAQTMLDTVSLWKFEPPLAAGNLTNTMVRQTFAFTDGKLTAAEAH